ncbi:15413_t:CDS:2 [Entrophospora sp. SA101]|nr:15413_t:CDS:2 [Entrophospora sp. SA101]
MTDNNKFLKPLIEKTYEVAQAEQTEQRQEAKDKKYQFTTNWFGPHAPNGYDHEKTFRENIQKSGKENQVEIIKGKSFDALTKLNHKKEEQFDFIYIDDYFEEEYNNPRIAIDAFLKCYQTQIEIIYKRYQRSHRAGRQDNLLSMAKRALVCGAGGFIGNHLVKKLKKEGFWVRGLDIKKPEFSNSVADEFIICDLRNLSTCRDYINEPFDEVYQLAADMGGASYIFTQEHDADILYNNSIINLNVLRSSPAAICRKVAESGEEIEIFGDGQQTRSFLYIDDCLEAIRKLMDSEDFRGSVNIGSEEMVSVNQLVQYVLEIANKKLRIKHISGPLGVRGRNSDNKLIKEKLG